MVPMTLQDALTALLDEYHIEEFVECVRDEAKSDPAFTGYSKDHPRVQRFQEICRVLRAEQQAEPSASAG